MGCFGCEDEPGKGMTSINKHRGCTDFLIFLLYVATWAAVVIVFVKAVQMGGDPNKLIRGTAYDGKVCGKDAAYLDKPLQAWPFPLEYGVTICVTECSETYNFGAPPGHGRPYSSLMLISYKSEQFLYYCVPSAAAEIAHSAVGGILSPNNTAPTNSTSMSSEFSSVAQTASRAIGDLSIAWPIIIAAAGIALVVSFIYTWILKRFAGVLVWGGIFLVLGGGVILGFSFLQKANDAAGQYGDSSDRAKAMKILGIVVFALTGVFFLIIVALRDRIRIAVEIVKEASNALEDMPLMVVFPAIPFLFCLAYVAYWVVEVLFIFSVTTSTASIPLSNTFLAAVDYSVEIGNYFVLAGSVAEWYFTPYTKSGSSLEKKRGDGPNLLSDSPVKASFWRAIRYHLGTIMFGALIIAIIQFIRAWITYMEAKAKRLGPENILRKIVFCLLQCFLKCLECCMDKINKNAYIYCAIYGQNFCYSACGSFKLVWRNLARVAAINMVGDYLLVIGKIAITLVTTGLCGIILINNDTYKQELSSVVLPLVIIFILAFAIGSLFMVVYETAIDTVFLCFLVDEETNGKTGMMLASPTLQAIIGQHAQESKDEAELVKDGRQGDTATIAPAPTRIQ